MYYRTCPECGAHLDPGDAPAGVSPEPTERRVRPLGPTGARRLGEGEKCDCQEQPKGETKEGEEV